MLEFLRKTKRGVFGILTICFLGALLIPFGVGVYTGSNQNNSGISVNGGKITPNEFYLQLENWDRYYRAQLKDGYEQLKPFLNLRQRTAEELINRKLLENYVSKINLTVSASQIQDKIRSHPYFQGNLTKESLQEFLDAQGLNSFQLENITKKELINEQLISSLALAAIPSELELKKIYELKNQKFSFKYLSFDSINYEAAIDTNDENALKSFYADHAEQYRRPTSVNFQYIKFSPSEYKSQVEISENDLLSFYEKEKHTFIEPKMIRLRQIVIKKEDSEGRAELKKLVSGEKASEDRKKKLAETILSKANSGEDFANIAKSFSEDEKTAFNGGDLGWLKYEDLDSPIRNTAAELEEKVPSSLIEHNNAYYILFAEDKKEARTKEFSEVRGLLEERLREEDAPIYARARAQEFLDKWLIENNSLSDAAKNYNLSLVQTKGFVSTEHPSNISPELIKNVVELGSGSKNIIDIGNDAFVIEVLETKASYIPDFDEVKAEVIKQYSKEKARELAKSNAENTLQKLRAITNQGDLLPTLNALAQELKLELKSLNSVSQSSAQKDFLSLPHASRIAFSLSENNRVASQTIEYNNSFIVLALEQHTLGDESNFEKEKSKLKTAELQAGSSRLLSSLITALKSRATVIIDPSLLEENT